MTGTTQTKPQRRTLQFTDFDAVAAEVERLATGGFAQAGNWDLAQVCNHLMVALEGSMREIPVKAPWPVRVYCRLIVWPRLVRTGRFREGVKAPAATLPKPGADQGKAVARLKRALGRFAEHDGTFGAHPFFGALTRDQWRQFHLVHCAHHLGFLVPASSEVK